MSAVLSGQDYLGTCGSGLLIRLMCLEKGMVEF